MCPAKSKAQQKLFGIARAVQKGARPESSVSDPAKKIAKTVNKREVEKFASTPTKGLPDRVKKEMKEAIKELVSELLTEASKLTPDQIKYGAMYLAASNLGMDMSKVKDVWDIKQQWHQIAGSIESETGESVEPELKDWIKMLSRGDSYSVGAIKKELPFLFESINEAQKVYVYGTRDNKWHLVGPEDRDYKTGIPQDVFKKVGPEAAKKMYLQPHRLENITETPESKKYVRNQKLAAARANANPQDVYKQYTAHIKTTGKQPMDYEKWLPYWKGKQDEGHAGNASVNAELEREYHGEEVAKKLRSRGISDSSIVGVLKKLGFDEEHAKIILQRVLESKVSQLAQLQEKLGRVLTVPEKHQLAIAYKTMKMPEAMLGVMGGPTKAEAQATIKRLTGRDYKERTEEGTSPIDKQIANVKLQIAQAEKELTTNIGGVPSGPGSGSGMSPKENVMRHIQDLRKTLKQLEIQRKSTKESVTEARSIGVANKNKLKKIIVDMWKHNHDVSEDEIVDKLPEEWWDTWEMADQEIRRIINDTLMNLTHGRTESVVNEAPEKFQCPKCGKPITPDANGLHKCSCGWKEQEPKDEGFKVDKGIPVKEQYKFNPEYAWLKKMAQKNKYQVGPVTVLLAFDPKKRMMGINAMMVVNPSHPAQDAPRHIEAALDGITGEKDTLFKLDKIAPHKDKTTSSSIQKLWLLPSDKISTWGGQSEQTDPQKKADLEKVKKNMEQIKSIQSTLKTALDGDRKTQLQAAIQKLRDENRKLLDKHYPQTEGVTEVAPKGWEGTVKAMKKHKEIDNPWALAHYMKGQGMKSHKKESVSESTTPFELKDEEGNTWYLTYIDPSHLFASSNPNKKGTPYHISQIEKNPHLSMQFVSKIHAWLYKQAKQQKESVTEAGKKTCLHTTHIWEDWEGAPFGYFERKYVTFECSKKKYPESAGREKFCSNCGKPVERKIVKDERR